MKYVFINGTVLDGSENMVPREGLAVFVNGETIQAVVPQQEASLEGYQVIDLKGKYLMPGLINLHVHLPSSGKPKKKPSDPVKTVKLVTSTAFTRWILYKICASLAKNQLLSGVTTIRTVGGVLDVDTRIRDDIAAGKLQGPRILAANAAVSVPGGHMAGSVALACSSTEEAVRKVREIAAEGVDLIKLMITGGVLDATEKGEPGVLRMQPEMVKACCDEAHRLGLKVAAHVESPEGVRVALENGVDSIEHGAKPDEEILRLFKEKNACHVATLSPALPYALFDRSISGASEMAQYNGNIVFEGIKECAKECLENDIPVGLGTDTGCPYITHYDMWREVNYFHKFCGVSNTFALYTATKRNAELVGLGDKTGTVEAGKAADLIAVEQNPLEDLKALRNMSLVMARGKLILNPHVKKMAEVEKELDKFL